MGKGKCLVKTEVSLHSLNGICAGKCKHFGTPYKNCTKRQYMNEHTSKLFPLIRWQKQQQQQIGSIDLDILGQMLIQYHVNFSCESDLRDHLVQPFSSQAGKQSLMRQDTYLRPQELVAQPGPKISYPLVQSSTLGCF